MLSVASAILQHITCMMNSICTQSSLGANAVPRSKTTISGIQFPLNYTRRLAALLVFGKKLIIKKFVYVTTVNANSNSLL